MFSQTLISNTCSPAPSWSICYSDTLFPLFFLPLSALLVELLCFHDRVIHHDQVCVGDGVFPLQCDARVQQVIRTSTGSVVCWFGPQHYYTAHVGSSLSLPLNSPPFTQDSSTFYWSISASLHRRHTPGMSGQLNSNLQIQDMSGKCFSKALTALLLSHFQKFLQL